MKLLYKGKSNKRFTHNHFYNYFGSIIVCVIVYDNKNSMVPIKDSDYFEDNFEFFSEKEIKTFERKMKLKKIKNGL